MDAGEISRALTRIAHEIIEHNGVADDLLLLGVHTRGAPLADRVGRLVADLVGRAVAVGSLDAGPYRDDLDSRPAQSLGRTEVPGTVEGRAVVLVDDVLFTGRTIRAALDALTDLGRPGDVQLAILVDRGHREIPIRADYVGKNVPTSLEQWVTVRLDDVDGEEGVWIESLPHQKAASR
jgi:pyrimidine operon attenuation protein/uracil phosphoribosyltransferase